MTHRRTLVVIGHGMVGHKLLEILTERSATAEWDIVTFCEEPRPAYDRVGLSSFFEGNTEEDLSLVGPGFFDQPHMELHLGDPIVAVDRDTHTIESRQGRVIQYDALVLATGSYPFVPPIPGHDAEGAFVYRTLDDLVAIREHAAGARVGAVVGGGLLGLEAANALRSLGLETHVLEAAPHLMPAQLDPVGGLTLQRRIEALGVVVHTGVAAQELAVRDGVVSAVRFHDADELPVDLVVFSAGIRPRDDIARACGLELGERGGIVVDEACRTADPRVYAIGECALVGGRIYGLVSPGYQMAAVVADRILGGDATFGGADLSTKLKLLGVDVASFGDAHAAMPDARVIAFHDPVGHVAKRLVVSEHGTVIGGTLVGDATAYAILLQMARGGMPTPEDPSQLVLPAATATNAIGLYALAGSASICSCNNVTKDAILDAIVKHDLIELAEVKRCTSAGTGCGGCVPLVTTLLKEQLRAAGREVRDDLCEHFAYSRQELFDIVRAERVTSFADLVARHGRGHGCEICKPAVASMFASLGTGYILDGEQATLQDTNDHFLANLQRNGTYSVVPRVPGGEITPQQLIVLGEVARDFSLYTKITGGQRIDLFGARVEQLPAIWRRLVDAGFESGHAYGKALRTVKSCVGQTWCRYGVQDSTALAIQLELRYRGLRSPHKLKSAVSGCARECAEAQGKDFGVIATERGWNLFVCGNGGLKPQHAVLLAEGLDTETLIRAIDRFLMFYIRTADRLERTATWFNKLDGGVEYLRRVILDDSLGIGAELDAAMAHHVATYECEWKATINDPERLRRFRTFVNTDEPDPHVRFVLERGQPRPVTAALGFGATVGSQAGV
ncbi:MAG TPA: nitrite reductase large subunit NirB [Acidimicrobiia bacterium]